MSRSEIHEVRHRIYTVGRSRQLGINGFELRDQNQTVLEKGSYIECMNALHNLKLTAARRAWMGSSTITPSTVRSTY